MGAERREEKKEGPEGQECELRKEEKEEGEKELCGPKGESFVSTVIFTES